MYDLHCYDLAVFFLSQYSLSEENMRKAACALAQSIQDTIEVETDDLTGLILRGTVT